MKQTLCGALAAMAIGAPVFAAQPQLGGPMKHLLVTLQGSAIHVDFESGNPDEVMMMQDYGDAYTGSATVLNGVPYNGQYGWLAGGFISLPPGARIWIESIAQSDGLGVYEQGTFDPIFTTDGAEALWWWNGTMVHNWYTAPDPGNYEATYRVYVGDSAGAANPAFDSAFVTIRWMVPAPPCSADINGDGIVDTADLGQMIGAFGSSDPASDLNSDGAVDTADLGQLLGEFGSTCSGG